MTESGCVRLDVNNLNKSFSVPVLDGVSLRIACGEVHAIVGENGAGKSTLVNILAGLLAKDSGEMFLDGNPYDPSDAKDAFNHGVSFVAQELSTIGTLTAAENISIRELPRRHSVILRDELNSRAMRLLARVGLEQVSPTALASELSLAECQLLELAKALTTDCRLLVLDEPTSALSAPQAERIHEIVAELAAAGTSIVYISHRLDDVLRISDTVTILRDGQVVASVEAGELSVTSMMQQMAGRDMQKPFRPSGRQKENPVVLEVNDITTGKLPSRIRFSCHAGEIVGIAGLTGSGRSELLDALFGLQPLTGGSVSRCIAEQKHEIRRASQAISHGVGYLGEDRQAMSLFHGKSVLVNITLPGLPGLSSRIGIVDRARELAAGSRVAEKLAIRCTGLHQEIDQLSGGNQQKALIARWLLCDSEIFLLDEPTRGIDVGTKNAIYELLFELQERDKTILISSSEIEELMTVCDRILVLSNRKLVKEFVRDHWSEAEILAAAFAGFTQIPTTVGTADQRARGPVHRS
jgi:ribose transport system ATP-binding protein